MWIQVKSSYSWYKIIGWCTYVHLLSEGLQYIRLCKPGKTTHPGTRDNKHLRVSSRTIGWSFSNHAYRPRLLLNLLIFASRYLQKCLELATASASLWKGSAWFLIFIQISTNPRTETRIRWPIFTFSDGWGPIGKWWWFLRPLIWNTHTHPSMTIQLFYVFFCWDRHTMILGTPSLVV